jgi:hypothetical protein
MHLGLSGGGGGGVAICKLIDNHKLRAHCLAVSFYTRNQAFYSLGIRPPYLGHRPPNRGQSLGHLGHGPN